MVLLSSHLTVCFPDNSAPRCSFLVEPLWPLFTLFSMVDHERLSFYVWKMHGLQGDIFNGRTYITRDRTSDTGTDKRSQKAY